MGHFIPIVLTPAQRERLARLRRGE